MLWAVWHECPSGAQFIFNYYRHWATMEVRDLEYGSSHFLHSKEGANQGYPLAMIAYVIRFLPFIQELRDAHPYVTKTWYEDDAGAGGEFGKILTHFRDLQARATPRGYFLEPTKSILIGGLLPGNGDHGHHGESLPRGSVGDREAKDR